MLLSEQKIRNAKPKAKMYRLRDGNSLFLQVESKGGKYWRLMYRYAEKQKTLALGTYPEVSLAEARDLAYKARKTLASGVDPGAQKREEKRQAVFSANNTFEGVAKEWFENNKPQWTKEHADRLWRRIEIHLIAEMGKRPIAEISTLELLEVIRKVEKQKITKGENRVKRRGGTDVSHRVLQTVSGIFNYAIVTERMTTNPAFPLRDGRALASTTLNEMGFPPDVIERQLAHAERNKIRAAYNRAEYLPQREAIMQTWADLIDSLVAKKGNVVIGKFGKAA